MEGLITLFKDINSGFLNHVKTKVLAIEFISIDKPKGKELNRWLVRPNDDIETRYDKAVEKFLRYDKDGNATRTLTTHDLVTEPYHYNSWSIKENTYNNNISTVIRNEDLKVVNRGIFLNKIKETNVNENSAKTNKLIRAWDSSLQYYFKGSISCMWVPQPHLSHDDRMPIYNSVFLVFAGPISGKEQYKIAKAVRDFIIQHLIDLFVRDSIEVTLDLRERFIPDYVNSNPAKENLVKLYEELIRNKQTELQQLSNAVLQAIKANYDCDTKQWGCNYPKLKYNRPADIYNEKKGLTRDEFLYNLQGRFVTLALYLIFCFDLNKIASILHTTSGGLGKVKEFNRYFFIRYLKDDDLFKNYTDQEKRLKRQLIISELAPEEKKFLCLVIDAIKCSNDKMHDLESILNCKLLR